MPQEDLIKKLIKQRKIIIIAVVLLFLIGFAVYFSFYYLGSGMYAASAPLYERIIPYAPYQPSVEPTIEIKEGIALAGSLFREYEAFIEK
jgi:flagellar basal body-associated protein FliL